MVYIFVRVAVHTSTARAVRRCELRKEESMPKEKRASFYVSDQTFARVEKLKRGQFYNKSYAELFRALVEFGLDEMDKQKIKAKEKL